MGAPFLLADPIGVLVAQTVVELRNRHVWEATAKQILVASRVWRLRIRVHTRQGYHLDYGSEGLVCHLLYHNRPHSNDRPNHYDVLCPIDRNGDSLSVGGPVDNPADAMGHAQARRLRVAVLTLPHDVGAGAKGRSRATAA